MARAPAAKAGGPGFDSQWLPWIFLSSSWLTNVDGMKDLWCSSAVRLLSTQIAMNERIYGALIPFGCYQHRYEWKGLWCSDSPLINNNKHFFG